MTSRLGVYAPGAAADPPRAVRAAVLDLLVSVAVGMLLWPFPLIRLTLGLPVTVHVALILAWILIVFVIYLTVTVAVWGRTPVMYLLDLGLAGRPRPFGVPASLRWGLGWLLAVLPAMVGARGLADPSSGLPARFSGLATVVAQPPPG